MMRPIDWRMMAGIAAGMTLGWTIWAGDGPTPVGKEGGIGFRFDDNKSLEQWQAMTAAFDRHGYPLMLAINMTSDDCFDAATRDFLRRAAGRGHELLDHTPAHSGFFFLAADADRYRQNSRVDHVNGSRVCGKYLLRKDVPAAHAGLRFRAVIDGNVIRIPEAYRKPFLPENGLFLYRGKAYIAYPDRQERGLFHIRSFWSEPVDLGQPGEVEVESVSKQFGFAAPPEWSALLAEVTRNRREKMGLPRPTAWIQPGGYEAILQADNVRDGYRAAGYTNAATYQNSALKIYCEPDPGRCAYAMQWGQIHLERNLPLDRIKKQIADSVAKHQVLFAASHMSVGKVPGGFPAFVKLHDELLAWCREQKIAVRTQSEWARRLYDSPTDPRENILPPWTADRDGDGTPDGYVLGPGVKVAGDALLVPPRSLAFRIEGLGGVEKGRNVLTLDAAGGVPRIRVWAAGRGWRKELAALRGATVACEVPADTTTLTLEVWNDDPASLTLRAGRLAQDETGKDGK